jgi:hypothetical protein
MSLRKTIPVFVLVLAAAAFTLAEGQSESGAQRYGAAGLEQVKVSGKLSLEDRMHPELESGGKTYELMVPWFLTRQIELQEGEQVTVEGYQVPGPRWESGEGDEIHVRVTKAVIRGKEYDVDRLIGSGMGPGGPMMGSWGGMMDRWGPGRSRGSRRW